MTNKIPWKPANFRASNKKAMHLKLLKVFEETKKGTTQEEIGAILNPARPVSRQQVYNLQVKLTKIINPATGKPFLERSADNKQLVVPKESRKAARWELMQKDPYLQVPEIKNLVEHLQSKNQGEGRSNTTDILSHVLVVLNTICVHPRDLLDGSYRFDEEIEKNANAEPDHLIALTKCMTEFKQHMKAGTVKYNYAKTGEHAKGIAKEDRSIKHYIMAVRQLFEANGKPIPRGYGGKGHILSGAKENFGAYNDVQLTDIQKLRGIGFMREKYGDQYASFFALMFEMFTRPQSLYNWIPNFNIKQVSVDGFTCKYLETKVFESKTHKHWIKTIIDPVVIEIADKIKGRKLISENEKDFMRKFSQAMRDFFAYEGLLPQEACLATTDPQFPKFKKGTKEFYLVHNPIYVLRHSGAHMAMRRTRYNATIVAAKGWETIDVLVKAYAGLPSEYEYQDGVCYYCNPPPDLNTENLYFCSGRHALVFLQNGRKPKFANALSQIFTNASKNIIDIEDTTIQIPEQQLTSPTQITFAGIHDIEDVYK